MKYLKKYKIFEELSGVDKKIRLIEDLTIELTEDKFLNNPISYQYIFRYHN